MDLSALPMVWQLGKAKSIDAGHLANPTCKYIALSADIAWRRLGAWRNAFALAGRICRPRMEVVRPVLGPTCRGD